MGIRCSKCKSVIYSEGNIDVKDIVKGENDITYNYNLLENSVENEYKKLIFLQRALKRYLLKIHTINSHIPNKSLEKLNQGEFVMNSKNDSKLSKNIEDKGENIINDLCSDSNEEKKIFIDILNSNIDLKENVIKVNNCPIGDYAIYSGDMKDNLQHGVGKQIWKDGARYEGEWKYGKANGYGTFYHVDGDIYKGNWKNDKANGQGKYTSKDGVTYDGLWFEDFQDGYGVETWKDGAIYKGNYKMGKKNGHGEYIWKDRSKYIGNWCNNFQEGYGTFTWPNGKVYKGNFHENYFDGEGHYKSPDGSEYIGNFSKGKKNGIGKFFFGDGRFYLGFWEDNKQHGLGLYNNEKGRQIFGIWVKGRRIRWINEDEISEIKNDSCYKLIINFNKHIIINNNNEIN